MFELRHVTLRGAERSRLDRLALTISPGRTALVGYSGAGKTSLLNVLAGFETPDEGAVVRSPVAASTSSSTDRLPMYWVPQNGGLWSHLTVDQHLHCVNKVPELTDEILRSLDLEPRRRAFPGELSQGERSRLSLARALATRAEVLLMDEPLSHVDPIRKPAYWKAVQRLIQAENVSLVFSSHEPETVLRESDQVICLHEGRLVFQGPTRELYQNPCDRFAGEFLGALNWFAPEEQVLFLNKADLKQAAIGVRPERLVMLPGDSSPLEVVRVLFQGAYAESVVKHAQTGQTRTILHQPTTMVLAAGQKVNLRVVG